MGPYAESSTLYDDVYRSIAGLPGVAQASNVAYLTVQVRHDAKDVRAQVAGFERDKPGEPPYLIAGRPVVKNRYEAIADIKLDYKPFGTEFEPLDRDLGKFLTELAGYLREVSDASHRRHTDPNVSCS